MQRRLQRHRLKFLLTTLLLSTAVLGGTLLFRPSLPPAEGSLDVTFARDMTAHHMQAVNMSVTLLKRAADPKVKLLAQDILLTQQAQVGQMQGWLMAWGRPLAGREAPMAGMNRAHMGMASAQEERDLERLPVRMAETRFLVLMRRHHQGGVAMAKSALTGVKRPEVHAFAQRVVTSQASEIQVIDAMLSERNISSPRPKEHPEGMEHD